MVILNLIINDCAFSCWFFLFRWDKEKPASASNLILLKFKEVSSFNFSEQIMGL
jgi:hypothetical protein